MFDGSVGEAFKRRDKARRPLSSAGVFFYIFCLRHKEGEPHDVESRPASALVWLCMSVLYAWIAYIFFMSERSVWTWLDAPRSGVLSRFSRNGAVKKARKRLHTHTLEPSKLTVAGRDWLYFPGQFPSSPFTSVCLLAPWQPAVRPRLQPPARPGLHLNFLFTNGFSCQHLSIEVQDASRLIWQEASLWLVTLGALSS